MTEPLIGIGRITVPYTVNSLNHVCRMFVDNPSLSGSDWVISKRPSIGGTGNWETAAEVFAAVISFLLASGATAGTALLEEYSSTGWLPRASHTVTLPNLAGNAKLASQVTLTLRDTNFTRPKIVVMEQNQEVPFHFDSPTAGAGGLDSFIAEFTSAGVVADNPYTYMVNWHGHFLQDSSFVSVGGTFNRKLRRARGLA